MLNELTCVKHVEESVQEKKPAGSTFLINSQQISREESKQSQPKMSQENLRNFNPAESKSSSSVEIEVNNRKYFAEELVLFKHYKLTLEVFF
jgi:hypothetical protein